MQQKKVYLIIGVILGILGIGLLTVYLRIERVKMAEELKDTFREERKTLESVVVAVANIPRGTTITSRIIGTEVISRRYVQPNAVKSVNEIIGVKTIIPISKGEYITFNKLAIFREGQERTLASAVPVGKRGITIKVDKISSVAGMIKAGDYVDVIALFSAPMRSVGGKQITQTITLPLFQNVLILAIGQEVYDQKSGGDQGILSALRLKGGRKVADRDSAFPSLVTLALSPQDINYLSFISEQGKIRLVLRSPADAKVKEVPIANWESLFQYVNSLYPGQQKTKEIKEMKRSRQVEIYRGFNKSYMAVAE